MTTLGVTRLFEWALLGMLASSSAAVAASGVMEAPSIAVAVALALRALRVTGLWTAPIPSGAFNAAAILFLGFWSVDYTWLSRDFLQSTLRLVGFLSAAMILRAHTARDYFFVKLVALMQMVAASVLYVGFGFFLCFAVFAACGLAAQISGEIHTNIESRPAIAKLAARGVGRRLALLTAGVLGGIVLIGGALFLVLPRTATAALRTLERGGIRLPGFANEIRLGEIGQIRMMSTPVMHVRIDGPQRDWQLKWRGSALASFDGKRWYNTPDAGTRLEVEGGHVQPAPRRQLGRAGQRISYEVQLKSVSTDLLFFAGIPESVGIDARFLMRTAVDGYSVPRGLGRGIRYQVFRALIPDERQPVRDPGVLLPEAARARYLELPPMDPRVAELARTVSAEALSRLAKARLLESHLRQSYPYTVELPAEEPADPVGHFLFERKKGHCEYFASSMAVMLRAIDIPSRVATGFQSGTYNPVSGWRLIRSSDAHSWVEAWIDGYGWLTFDPTPPGPPAVAAWYERAAMYVDAADVFWQEWVINYDFERQLSLVDRLGRGGRGSALDWTEALNGARRGNWTPDWSRLPLAIGLAALALAARYALPFFARWRRRRERVDKLRRGQAPASDAALLYERMLQALRAHGFEKPAWMTPSEFARCVTGPHAALVEELTGCYLAFRFGERGSEAPRMLALLERLEAAPKS